ncbi:MAG: SBBP repeat-containing protein [Bacteroidota bacterium]
MKSAIFTTAFLLMVCLTATSQSTGFEWAKGITCSEEFSPSSVQTDSDGYIIVAGEFSDRADFDPGIDSLFLESNGYDDIFFSKFNSLGQLLWAKNIGGKYNDVCNSMTLDDSNNIFITGRFTSTVDFDPGNNSYEITQNGMGDDIYVAKYDSAGNFKWVVSMGFPETTNEGTSITIDDDGNVLVTGWFQGTVDFNPGAGVHNLSTARVSCFILKLSANGEFIWAEKINSPDGWVEGHTIRTDSKNNVYVSGLFKAATDFNPGESTHTLEPVEDYAAFLVKLDKNANFRWAIQPGGYAINTNLDKKRPFEIDSEGNIILAFDFSNTVDFNPSEEETLITANGNFTDVFIQKLDSLGNLLWVNQIGGPDYDDLGGLSVDASGNIYITGYFTGTVDFAPGNSTYELTAGEEWDIGLYIAKYTPEGNLTWAHPINWEEDDGSWPYGYGIDITTDPSGNVISVGKFGGKYNFNPNGIPSVLNSADSEFSFSGYVIKLNGITTTINHFKNDISFIYYPNPFSDKITISGSQPLQNAVLWLRSVSGQTIIHKQNLTGNNIEINTGKIPAGVYFLELKQKDDKFVGKVIKQ